MRWSVSARYPRAVAGRRERRRGRGAEVRVWTSHSAVRTVWAVRAQGRWRRRRRRRRWWWWTALESSLVEETVDLETRVRGQQAACGGGCEQAHGGGLLGPKGGDSLGQPVSTDASAGGCRQLKEGTKQTSRPAGERALSGRWSETGRRIARANGASAATAANKRPKTPRRATARRCAALPERNTSCADRH